MDKHKNANSAPGAAMANGADKSAAASTQTILPPETAGGTQPQPPTIEERMEFFEGLESLVSKRRRLEIHKAAIAAIDLDEDELNRFENTHSYGARIELYDSKRNNYTVSNPRLLAEMKEFLLARLNVKVEELGAQILAYGN